MDGDLIFVDVAEPEFGIQVGVTLLHVHGPGRCAGQVCCIHNPSEHHMLTWPQNWRGDRGLMERVCGCGVGHPDPDDLAVRVDPAAGVHGCCQDGVLPSTCRGGVIPSTHGTGNHGTDGPQPSRRSCVGGSGR